MCESRITDAVERRDPTGTTRTRVRFEADLTRRFRTLRTRALQAVRRDDVFGLQGRTQDAAPQFTDADLQPRQFQFLRSSDKVGAFMEWLRSEENRIIFEVQDGTALESAAELPWANTYVQSAYTKGVRDAGELMRSAGANVASSWLTEAVTRPIHADRLGIAYTRVFTELKGITQAMDQGISRALAAGLGNGSNPAVIAREINKVFDGKAIVRARAMARTEVINAHADASLNGFTEAGIEGVEVVPEWSHAGDACEVCQALARQEWTITTARGQIPRHVNCRCAWKPKVVNGSGIVLR